MKTTSPPNTPAPKPRVKTSDTATQVADVKARARKMRGQGIISQKEHDALVAKADKISAALAPAKDAMS